MNENGKMNDWQLSPAPEGTEHVKIKSAYDLFIDGRFVKSSKGARFDSIDPAKETVIAQITESTSTDVNKAIKAARRAHSEHWKKMPGKERGKYIYRIARMMQERARELAVIESMDSGKVIRES